MQSRPLAQENRPATMRRTLLCILGAVAGALFMSTLMIVSGRSSECTILGESMTSGTCTISQTVAVPAVATSSAWSSEAQMVPKSCKKGMHTGLATYKS